MIDCNQFKGRKRDICRGYDNQGRPIAKSRRIVWLKYLGFSDKEIEEHLNIKGIIGNKESTNSIIPKIRNNNYVSGCGCSKRRS